MRTPFDAFRIWHPFRVPTFLGPVPGVSRGTAVPRSTPGYYLASLRLAPDYQPKCRNSSYRLKSETKV